MAAIAGRFSTPAITSVPRPFVPPCSTAPAFGRLRTVTDGRLGRNDICVTLAAVVERRTGGLWDDWIGERASDSTTGNVGHPSSVSTGRSRSLMPLGGHPTSGYLPSWGETRREAVARVVERLSARRPVFHSEADFQLRSHGRFSRSTRLPRFGSRRDRSSTGACIST